MPTPTIGLKMLLRHYRTMQGILVVPVRRNNRGVRMMRLKHGSSLSSAEDEAEVTAAKVAADVTLKGMALNIFLSTGKFSAGIASNSPALISDGAHSFRCVLPLWWSSCCLHPPASTPLTAPHCCICLVIICFFCFQNLLLK